VIVSAEDVETRDQATIADKSSSARSRPKHSRAPQFVQRYRALHLTWRAVVFFVGVAIITAGIAGLVLPILPGWALVFVGFAVLATEFVWAQRLLLWVRQQAAKAASKATDPRARRRNLALFAIFAAVFIIAVAWVVWRYEVPYLS
jgi:uncharacterized protein (TIGR02611 family)